MTARVELSLASNGDLLLHLPMHSVTVPMTVTGLSLIRHVLQARTKGERELSLTGNPTQWDFDRWLKSPSGQGALQLAGARKRWKEAEAKTGVRTRQVPANGRRRPLLDLSNLELEDLL